MTACELMEEMAFNGRRPRGQEEREKAKMLMESVAEIGCQTPQWGGDRAAMRQGAIERRIPYSILNQNSKCNEAKSVAGKIRLLLQV